MSNPSEIPAAMGHEFDGELLCHGCRLHIEAHWAEPKPCQNPPRRATTSAGRPRKMLEEEVREMRAMRAAGTDPAAIAVRMGISRSSVYRLTS